MLQKYEQSREALCGQDKMLTNCDYCPQFQKALEIYNKTNQKLKALGFAGFLMGWDMQTEAPKCADHSAEMATLSEMGYLLETSPEYKQAIDTLYENRDNLSELLKHEITVAKEGNDKISKIPMEEYVAFSTLTNEFYNVYVNCKQAGDFETAMPYYQKIIDYRRKYVKWLETDKLSGYDLLLDEFERDTTSKDYDEFFALLKEKLVPLIAKINAKQKREFAFNNLSYSKEGQLEFQEYVRDVFGFDRNYTVIK